MLLKLTCPACGRSDQASDRVIGKEVRCPCGATFRVLGPKHSSQSRPELPVSQPRPVRRNTPRPHACLKTDRGRLPPLGRKQDRPRASDQTGSGASQPCQDRQGPRPSANHLPPACLHGLTRPLAEAQSFFLSFCALIVSLNSGGNPPSRKPAPTDNAVVAQVEPAQTQPETDSTTTTVPQTEKTQPLIAANETVGLLSPPAAKPASTPLTTAQIVARREPSVALIKGKVSSGTGFLVRYGVIATNCGT